MKFFELLTILISTILGFLPTYLILFFLTNDPYLLEWSIYLKVIFLFVSCGLSGVLYDKIKKNAEEEEK